MKIQSNNVQLTKIFLEKTLTPFDVIKYPIRDLLKNWEVIIGYNPIQSEFPYPWCNPISKQICLPFYNVTYFGMKDVFINTDCQKGMHEIGHVWHFVEMPNVQHNDPKWKKYSEKTGYPLDFEYHPRTQVPSFEGIAYDFEKFYYWKLPDPYFELMGATKTVDYIVLNACEVAKGYVATSILEKTQQGILNKYK